MDTKIEEAIRKHHMIPKSIYERPMTSAHEIGWFSKPLVDNRKWTRPKSTTPVTRYAEDYERLYHKNPFKIPISNFKMK